MHNTIGEAAELVKELVPLIDDKDREVVLCPSFISLSEISKLLKGTNIKLGAQNMYHEDKGAFTGEVSPIFLKEIGVTYAILGHSERRHIFGEKDELINNKVKSALKHDLSPILCVGETLTEREEGITHSVIRSQIEGSLTDLQGENLENLVIAYEPVWAIGTGKTATKEDANEVIGYIRQLLSEIFGRETGNNIRILYGGSVKPGNIKELMEMEQIDGALVGGASLKAEDFAKITNY